MVYCPDCECPTVPTGYFIAVYGVVLLCLLFILMFIAICGLSYIIYRMKRRKYQRQICTNSENLEARSDFVRQQSNEVPEPLPLQKINTLDSSYNQGNILSMVDTEVKEKPKVENGSLSRPPKQDFVRPVNGAKLPIQPIITPDQMNKLCEAVLLKMKRNESTSLTHLNELLKDKDEDEFEEYDVVPKPKKLHSSHDDEDIEVYDCPPRTNNFHDEENFYDESHAEDTYENASFIHRLK